MSDPKQWDVHAVIDEQAIETVFQPIVHLDSGAIVGFEASSRGPKGSSLEAPLALLAAGAEAGRLGELDWLCRAHAVQAAEAADLPGSLAWFIKVEPSELDTACPEHLRPVWARALSELRVVLEVVERDGTEHAAKLVRVCDQARASDWGVSINHVGADPVSLALLPLLQPDVVKLDMLLLLNTDNDYRTVRAVAAVDSYAERNGAVVFAEGIETNEQAQLAKGFGAHFGQGNFYGEPGPLPETVPTPREAIPLRLDPEPVTTATAYEVLAAAHPVRRGEISMIGHMSSLLEDLAFSAREPGVVLACFPNAKCMSAERRERYQQLAAANSIVVVFGDKETTDPESHFRTVTLPGHSPAAKEWAVIVLNLEDAGAMVAQDSGELGQDGHKLVNYVHTYDRDLVKTVARALIGQADDGSYLGWLASHDEADSGANEHSWATDPETDDTGASENGKPGLLRRLRRAR